MLDILKDSIIVNLTENRFLQPVTNIKLIHWHWFLIHYAAQRKLSFNNVQFWQYLDTKLSFIYFCFTQFLLLLVLFWKTLSWCLPLKVCGGGTFFLKNLFMGGQIYGVTVLHGGTNDQIIPRGRGVLQNAFSSNLDTKSENSYNHFSSKFIWRKSPDHSMKLSKILSLRILVKKF